MKKILHLAFNFDLITLNRRLIYHGLNNRSHAVIATTMNSVVLGPLSIKVKTAKPTLKYIMTSLTLNKTMHKVSITYSIYQTSVSIVFLCYILNRMYQILKFWIISKNKIETCGEIRIKWGDAVLFQTCARGPLN